MQVHGAQFALRPALYHRVRTACATKDVLLRKCVVLFGIFFFQNAALQKLGREKKGGKDQSINLRYQWLLLLVSLIERVFCTHISLIHK